MYFYFAVFLLCRCASLPFPSLPFPSLPFPSLPFPSLPFPSLPFPSLPFPSLPFPSALSLISGGFLISDIFHVISFPFLSFAVYFFSFEFLRCFISCHFISFDFMLLSFSFSSFRFISFFVRSFLHACVRVRRPGATGWLLVQLSRLAQWKHGRSRFRWSGVGSSLQLNVVRWRFGAVAGNPCICTEDHRRPRIARE